MRGGGSLFTAAVLGERLTGQNDGVNRRAGFETFIFGGATTSIARSKAVADGIMTSATLAIVCMGVVVAWF